jgi:acetyl esterase/lipase
MRIAGLVFGIVAALAAIAVLLLVIGAFLDPAGSGFAMTGAMMWTTFGPHLLLVALAALVLAVLALRAGARALGRFAAAASVLALAGAGWILLRIVLATTAAGGSVDPLAALALGKMTLPPPDAVETFATVDGMDLKAAIFRPAAGAAPAPVIVYIHGGGFMAGTNAETAADLRWFADRGWLAVSVDYRVFAPGKPTWDKATPDAACGLAWAAANAARLGGDPARLALLGDSAGGNLAINIGFAAADGRALSGCGGAVPVPKAIAVQYPAVDPLSIYRRGFAIPGFEPAMLMKGYVGGTPEDFPERIAAIASAGFITPKAPPTLIVEPEKDSLVVSDGVYDFAAKAIAAGVRLELVRIPFANHIYNQVAAGSLGNQAGRTIRLRFLEATVR